jgi:hypothetical protein
VPVPAFGAEPTPKKTLTSRQRVLLFVALCLVCVAGTAGYTIHAATRGAGAGGSAAASPFAPPPAVIAAKPHLVFMDASSAKTFGAVGLEALGAPEERTLTPLDCIRVYVAAGNGICMSDDASILDPYRISFFGPDFKVRSHRSLPGQPSRARVSADGRYGATTVFLTGGTYADESFTTQATIWDMATGAPIANLDDFTARKDGQVIHAPTMNYWGVTFSRQRQGLFYATLGTGTHEYLVRGDLASRRVEVLRDGVECPSVSPDGTRIAFKQRTGDPNYLNWRIAVLDVATLQDHPLAETHDVDDQAEWLDNQTVLYTLTTGHQPAVWAAPADGSGHPRLFIAGAESPAVAVG